jgi:hypothetical protein
MYTLPERIRGRINFDKETSLPNGRTKFRVKFYSESFREETK